MTIATVVLFNSSGFNLLFSSYESGLLCDLSLGYIWYTIYSIVPSLQAFIHPFVSIYQSSETSYTCPGVDDFNKLGLE
jgi:hypothetical protein